jgi:hypothetical protein
MIWSIVHVAIVFVDAGCFGFYLQPSPSALSSELQKSLHNCDSAWLAEKEPAKLNAVVGQFVGRFRPFVPKVNSTME